MEKIIIVTALFFNKLGNQSLLETVKYYLKTYHVIIITSASKYNDYYYKPSEIKEILPDNLTIIYTYQLIPDFLRSILRSIRKIIKIRKKTISISTELINLKYSKINIISAKVASFCFFHKLCQLTKSGEKGIICAYEIHAVEAVVRHKTYSKYNCNYKYMAKFQGTGLGFDYKNIGEKKIRMKYKLDIEAFKKTKYFDLCTITNDGTNGIDVLKYFHVDDKRIISLPNGISEEIKNIKPVFEKKTVSDKNITLFTLSRLIGWKRVYLSIEIMNVLINYYKDKRFKLNIYGYGTYDEVNFLNGKIKEYQLSDCVFVRGSVDHTRLVEIYNKNDIMLSLYKYTNVTNPVLEAIYLNIPLIVLIDKNLDLILKNIDINRVFVFTEITEDRIIKEIADFLHTNNFIFKDNQIMDDCFSWEKRLNLELKLLKS
jgi:glycosyltransferase involved in cell wall biosynthesis